MCSVLIIDHGLWIIPNNKFANKALLDELTSSEESESAPASHTPQ